MPEKSGTDAAFWAPVPVGTSAGNTTCPKTAVTEAAAAASIVNERKLRRWTAIPTSLVWFRWEPLG
jgi:hypothetical protein